MAERRQRWPVQLSLGYLCAVVAVIAMGVAVLAVARPYDQVALANVLPFQIAITFGRAMVGLAGGRILSGTAIGFDQRLGRCHDPR